MSFTKSDIFCSITQELSLPKSKSCQAVEHLIDILKGALAPGEDVLISGFGRVCVREKSGHRGRNPAKGDAMMLPAKRVVTFKCSGRFRSRCNRTGCRAGD